MTVPRRAFLAGLAGVVVVVARPRKPRPQPPTTGFGVSPFGTSAFGG